jgi:hypothetical protein
LVVARHVLFEYHFDILVSFPGVDSDRLAGLDGELDLTDENASLDIARAVVVMIVEAELACADTARMLEGLSELGLYRIGIMPRVVPVSIKSDANVRRITTVSLRVNTCID